MSAWGTTFSRVLRLSGDADAILRRLHSRAIASDQYHRKVLNRARSSAYEALFGSRNYPRLLLAEQELKAAVARGKAWDDALWSDNVS